MNQENDIVGRSAEGGGGESALPTDLSALAAQLDALGLAERSAAPLGMEARLVGEVTDALSRGKGTRGAAVAGIIGAAAQADALGRAERNAAGELLEAGVFRASRGEIAAAAVHGHAPALRLVGDGVLPRKQPNSPIVRRRAWIGIAAAVAVAGMGWVAVSVMNPSGSSHLTAPEIVSTGSQTETLAAELKTDLEDLFGSTGTAMLETSGSTASTDSAWLDEWLSEEAM